MFERNSNKAIVGVVKIVQHGAVVTGHAATLAVTEVIFVEILLELVDGWQVAAGKAPVFDLALMLEAEPAPCVFKLGERGLADDALLGDVSDIIIYMMGHVTGNGNTSVRSGVSKSKTEL